MSIEKEEKKGGEKKNKKVTATIVKNRVVTENHLDFLFELHEKGVQLPEEEIELLKKKKYIKTPKLKAVRQKHTLITSDTSVKTERAQEADKSVDIVHLPKGVEVGDDAVITKQQRAELTKAGEYVYEGDLEISEKDWLPVSKTEHQRDFVDWVNSINSGFQKRIQYKKLNLYVQQATEWLADKDTLYNQVNNQDRKEYALREFHRCKENTLYFLNKYLILKEGDLSSGARTYDAKKVHEVMCYMFDCGYSMMIGKGRQIAATSTLGGCALKKIVFTKNFFLKFITMDKESGIEIFEDKIKFPFGELPPWMKPEVSNDRDNLFRLSSKSGKKGTLGGVKSKLQVVAPSVNAINGGSPQLVMIDEAGMIGILGKMMKEARPTMFMQDPTTKKLVLQRQIIAWGTGGNMQKSGKVYEEEYNKTWDAWKKGEYSSGIVPLFFDWTTRPGMTREMYESEKKVYITGGPNIEEQTVRFRQHYPSIVEDMFLTSSKTLVSIDYINKNLERIRNLDHNVRPQSGYFDPIYDTSVVANENDDVPYKIIGATFVPTEDNDSRSSAWIFMHPKEKWINRYYKGTDPIMTDNGYSKMAAVIFDAQSKTISAIVNYRDLNHKHTFLQTMLLGLYYDTRKGPRKIGVRDLVESNIGTAYTDYVDYKGFYNSLVYRTELPEYFQGGGQLVGIDNRASRTKFIINKIHEFVMAYGDRIWIDELFIQLRTFTCTITAAGNETWGTSDKRKYFDDVLFAAVFAYICSLSFSSVEPKEIKNDEDVYTFKSELYRDHNGNLARRDIRKRL